MLFLMVLSVQASPSSHGPLAGVVTQPLALSPLSVVQTLPAAPLAPGAGTPFVAPADGVVVLAAQNFSLEGNLLIIDHGQGLNSATAGGHA